jgi:hypothetical protein
VAVVKNNFRAKAAVPECRWRTGQPPLLLLLTLVNRKTVNCWWPPPDMAHNAQRSVEDDLA